MAFNLYVGIILFNLIFYVLIVHKENSFVKPVRFTIIIIILCTGYLLTALISVLSSVFFIKNPEKIWFTASWIIRKTILPFIKLKTTIKGTENVDNTKPAIIVCNHQSFLDIIVVMHMWKVINPCTVVVKKAFFYMGPMGLFLWIVGCIFIDRTNSARAKRELSQKLNTLKEKKMKLWIFPEGTRNSTKEMLPFKKGAFYLAIEAQIPIIPTVVSSYSSFYNKKVYMFKRGHVDVEFLPPIPTEGLTAEDIPELSAKVRAAMTTALARVNQPKAQQ